MALDWDLLNPAHRRLGIGGSLTFQLPRGYCMPSPSCLDRRSKNGQSERELRDRGQYRWQVAKTGDTMVAVMATFFGETAVLVMFAPICSKKGQYQSTLIIEQLVPEMNLNRPRSLR
jgi:hypothetical protein